MSEMVERAARALCLSKRNSPKGYPPGWIERHANENWHLFEDDVRTVITAMHEPTDRMCAAPADAGNEHRAKAVWQDMIDEALR